MKNNKSEMIKMRCTKIQKKLLKIKAEKTGLSLSVFCLKSSLDLTIVERLTEEQIELYRMLIKYHNNFKSSSNILKNKDSNFYKNLNETANEIKTHLKNFSK